MVKNNDLIELLTALNPIFDKYGVDFYLIGARVKELWFQSKNIPPKKFSYDFDLAVLISSIEKYDEMIEDIIQTGKFRPREKNRHRLVFMSKELLIDLVPFSVLDKADASEFKNRFVGFSFIGLKEVYENTKEIELDEIGKVKLPDLAGLVLLKLIAWGDRPENRMKDLDDICEIFESYWYFEEDEDIEKNKDLYEEFDLKITPVLMISRQIKSIIRDNEALKAHLLRIVKKKRLIEHFSASLKGNYQLAKQYVKAIGKGIE